MSVYLDNSATTKICQEALNKYIEISEGVFGNPSSLHEMGVLAEKQIKLAKQQLFSSIGDKTSEAVFTASGTEANNLAILGRAFAKERYKNGSRIITTDSEHASVLEPLENLKKYGFDIIKIPTRGGIIDQTALSSALTKNTVLVTVMMVNNETGALYDLKEVSRLMREKSPEAVLHVDATQSYLKIPFTKKSIGADMITVSSHKIAGPKGVGALIIDKSLITSKGISPIIFGGGQEMGLRSGTENVPAVASFGEAIKAACSNLSERYEKMNGLRSYLIEKLNTDIAFSEVSMTLPSVHAPHILNITLPGIRSETMLHFLSSLGIYVSSGSACSSNSNHLSSALTAYGRSPAEADSSIRISFCTENTFEDIDIFADGLKKGLAKLSRLKK